MSDSKMREEFEAWAQKNYVVPGCDSAVERTLIGDGYRFSSVNAAWHGWQASRAALVIELPNQYDEKYREYFEGVEGGCFDQSKYMGDVKAAIEAAGVRVRT